MDKLSHIISLTSYFLTTENIEMWHFISGLLTMTFLSCKNTIFEELDLILYYAYDFPLINIYI